MKHVSKIRPEQKIYFAILVNIILPLAGMSTDIYLPSLPAISIHFGVTKALTQLTVTAYVFAIGLSQFIAGPISDAHGRKKLLLAAIFTQFIAVVAILFSPTIYWMMFFRFVQGLGAAFMVVPARAILNDIFEGHELKKQFNYCTISFALGPIIAPFIGGYLQDYFGWQANFIFILFYISLVAFLLLMIYQETILKTRHFSIHHLWKNYHVILSNSYFLSCAFFIGIIWSYVALFNVTGPFLIQTALHHTAITYGQVALTMGIAWFLGNILNRVLFHHDRKIKTQVALLLTFTTTLIMMFVSHFGFFNITTLAIPTFIIIMLSGLMFPIYVGECLVIFTDLAASANACLFGLIWIIFGSFTIIATLLKTHSLLPLSITYAGVSIISLLLYYGSIGRLK